MAKQNPSDSRTGLKRLTHLKTKISRLEKEANKAEGKLEDLKERMKQDWGCKTVKRAKSILKKEEKKEKEARKMYEEALERFENDWSEFLEEEG